MDAEVSLTLDACTWVLFTMFCTLTLISCMVLVTSSIAEDACNPILAESSEAPATWFEALATWDDASRTLRTNPARPSTIRENALPRVSCDDRGFTSTLKSPPAMDSDTPAISFRYVPVFEK